eukprot:TRINITY_DN20877_c0_g1_i2.p1 TRINITY_DN20877_c0_g1~~TRINITY_DN20877_c0_g1_i2.p1  ORF type:complete len:197 (+),score=24.46 TRINITY_DN20877_c0_g1_i2:64-591(+)
MDVSDLDAGDALHKYLIAEAGPPMAIESFAPLLDDFMKNEKKREKIMEKVQEMIPDLSVSEASAGKWYLKTMKNIVNKGSAYLEKEYARLSKLITDGADSLQPSKIQEFKLRQGVIDVFSGGKLGEAAAQQEASDQRGRLCDTLHCAWSLSDLRLSNCMGSCCGSLRRHTMDSCS